PQRTERCALAGHLVDLERAEHPGDGAEGGDHPGAEAHRARDLHGPHHVQEALGPAQVLDERGGADAHAAERDEAGAAAQAGTVGRLRADGEEAGTACDSAEEEVDGDRGPPRRRLDDGPAVVGVELLGSLDVDVLDDGALAAAVAHPDLAEAATAAALPGPVAAAAPGRLRWAVGVELGEAHRRAPRKDRAATATIRAAARPVRA